MEYKTQNKMKMNIRKEAKSHNKVEKMKRD